jgi:hypothetical protein
MSETTTTTPTTADRPRSDGRSVPDLVRELSHEGADLVRHEVALAKAEMTEKLDTFQRNLGTIAVGSAFLVAALLYGLWAVNSGVTLLLAQFMDAQTAVWLAPLILAAALGLIGWGMIAAAKSSIRREGVTPHATKETLEEDARWARSKARDVKREMKHG